MLNETQAEAKSKFIQLLKEAALKDTLEVSQLLSLNDKLRELPGSAFLVKSSYSNSPSIPVKDFRLSDIDVTTWAPRFEFTVNIDAEFEQHMVDWIVKNLEERDVYSSEALSYRGKMSFLFSSDDREPLAVLNGALPLNIQRKNRFKTVRLEDNITESTVLIPNSEYIEATFSYLDFTLYFNVEKPFEFLKNTPLEKLPNLLDITRGGSFA